MKSTFIVAGLIGFASAGGFALAAPASASCAEGFTSIPCTIAENVAAAPATTVGSLAAAPGQFVGGVASTAQIAGVGCPEDDKGNVQPCGLPAVPGQFAAGIAGLPGQFAAGANQIATAPQTIAGNLLSAPGVLANSLTHGGTYTPPKAPTPPSNPGGGTTP